jgi:hypothetical protein
MSRTVGKVQRLVLEVEKNLVIQHDQILPRLHTLHPLQHSIESHLAIDVNDLPRTMGFPRTSLAAVRHSGRKQHAQPSLPETARRIEKTRVPLLQPLAKDRSPWRQPKSCNSARTLRGKPNRIEHRKLLRLLAALF